MNDSVGGWRGRRVLVTGGTGLLGGAVVRELIGRGAEVVGLVRDRAAAAAFARHRLAGKVHAVHGRAEDLFRVHSALAVHEVAAVFHFAPDATTATVLDAARRYDSRVPVLLARPAGAAFAAPAGQPVGVARFGALFGGSVPAGEGADGPARDFVFAADAARACLALADEFLASPGARVEDHAFRSGWVMSDRAMAAAVRDVAAGRGVLNPPAPDNPFGWAPAAGLADALADAIAAEGEAQRGRFLTTYSAGRAAA